MNINSLLNNAIIVDCETYAEDELGREINIQTQHEKYLDFAQVKWVGIYVFKEKKEYYLEVSKDRRLIIDLLNTYPVLIGFNSEEFDYVILKNNGLISDTKYVNHIDCMKILGSSTFRDKNGFKYKGRGELMGYKFKKNSLEYMAQTMELPFQKSTIDYKIFKKDIYTKEEKEEIIKYLRNDIMATKGLFNKLWEYWMPFIDLLDWKYVENFSWIKSSIASLIYKSACYEIGVEPTYSEKKSKIEEMGGRVLIPKYEEATNVWYVDFTSLYPHIFCMFNLFAESEKDLKNNLWHGNDIFKVKGYYNVSYKHPLTKVVENKLKQRIELKKTNPDHPMVYTLKIFNNGLYGVVRSSIFEKVHTPNAGWDTAWLGQQIQEFTQRELEKYGFESIAGDTDSLFVVSKENKHLDKDYIQMCLKKIISKILNNVPFPSETFNIDIEHFIHYISFPFSEEPIVDEETRKILNKKLSDEYKEEIIDKKKTIIRKSDNKIVKQGRSWVKERMGKKKNYLYLYEKDGELKIEIVGLPIKKDGATALGMKIYKDVLEPLILENKRAKFSKEFIDNQLETYLKKKEVLELLSREFKVKPYKSYKVREGKDEPSGIHAQISKGYFGGGDGVIRLIKNRKIGNAGSGDRYCTIEEAVEANLKVSDLDLEKVYNELAPFIEYEENLTTV